MQRAGYKRVFSDPEKLREMLELFARGVHPMDLAIKYGCDRTSILHQAKKNSVVRGKMVELPVIDPSERLHASDYAPDPDEHLRQLEDAPKPPQKVYKYQHLFDEPMNQGKTYAQYVEDENRKLAPMRKARMRKAMEEKRERDKLRKKGMLPTLQTEDFMHPMA